MTYLRCRELYVDDTRCLLLVEAVERNIQSEVWLSYCSLLVEPVVLLHIWPDGIEAFDPAVGSIPIASLMQRLPQIVSLLASFDEAIASSA